MNTHPEKNRDYKNIKFPDLVNSVKHTEHLICNISQ